MAVGGAAPGDPSLVRVGVFEVDLRTQELRKNGRKVPLQKQPFQILAALLERPGDLITREELAQKLWAGNPNVDLKNLDRPVNRLREALGDDARVPRFIETLPLRGYRFIGFGPELRTRQDLPPQPRTAPTALPAGPGVDPSRPPYVGPQPFSYNQVDRFFGRTSECSDLVKRIAADSLERVIVVYSPSGAGKTSLLNTDLRTALMAEGYHVWPVARIGVSLAPSPDHTNLYTAAALTSMTTQMEPPLEHVRTWSDFLSTVPSAVSRKVLIVDQLEEILTTPLGPPSEKRDFFLELMGAIEADPALRIVFALREEFLPELQRVARDLERYWALFPLERLRVPSAKEAIVGPAELEGVYFDDDVIKALVDELARVRYVDRLGKAFDESGDFVEPLQLQIVCQALWKCLPAKMRHVSWTEINEAIPASAQAGNHPAQLSTAIATFVHSALTGLCVHVIQEVAREREFPIELIDLGCQQFISQRGTRVFIHQQADDTGFLPNHVVEALAQRHLLRIEDRSGERLFELAHDTLVEPVRVRIQSVDLSALQQLWSTVIRKITVECAASQGIDEIDLTNRLCRAFVGAGGAAIRVPTRSLETEIPPSVIAATYKAGLIKRTIDQNESFYELRHPRLAVALFRVRTDITRDPGPIYDMARIVFSSVASVITCVVFVMISRSVLQGLHLTLTQGSGDGFVNGWFQGVIGAIDFTVFIAPALSSWWFLIQQFQNTSTFRQSVVAAIIGGTAGLLGGTLVTANLLYAQNQNSLYEAGWLVDRAKSPFTAFTETGFGYCMLVLGIGLGVGSGLSTTHILRSSAWTALVAQNSKERSLSETVEAFVSVFAHILRHSWYVFLPSMAVAGSVVAIIFHLFLTTPPNVHRTIGESVVIFFGGEGIVAGLLFGIFALRTGFAIPAPDPSGESSH